MYYPGNWANAGLQRIRSFVVGSADRQCDVERVCPWTRTMAPKSSMYGAIRDVLGDLSYLIFRMKLHDI